MKKFIVASSYETAMNHARVIKSKAQALFDALEDTPAGFLDANDLGPLYEELAEALPALDFAIKDKSIAYGVGDDGRITR